MNTVTVVRKANALLVHENRKAEAWLLRESHVAIDNPSLANLYVTHMTGTSYIRLSNFGLTITLIQFLKPQSATGASTGQTRSTCTRTISNHLRAVVTEALRDIYD